MRAGAVSWLAWGFALLAGALVTMQAGANAQLKQSLQAPFPALLASYALGLGAVCAYALATQVSWHPSTGRRGRPGGRGWVAWPGRSTALPPYCWRANSARRP